MILHRYTVEEIESLAANLPGRSHEALRATFNAQFGLDLSISQITAACKNRGMINGLDGRFRPGDIPFNKGMKGWNMGGKETQFKKGHVPASHRAVGSECLRADGYVWLKIAEPKYWRQKHVLVWEALHGPRPAGHNIVFADSDRMNFSPDNLVLLTKAQHVVMCNFRLHGGGIESVSLGKLIADVKIKTRDRALSRKLTR